MIYNKKTILDYINGNDIENYKIEDLENDTIFMKNVIKYTRDKNMYNLCSDKVKKDFNFIKSLIEIFKDDKEYIFKISKDFILNEENKEEQRIELMVILSNYLKNIEDFDLDRIKIILYANYTIDKDLIDLVRINNKDDNYFIEKMGLGFLIIKDKYDGNDIILNYYAEKFIIDLLDDEEIDLEKYIHINFKTYEDLKKYGINKFLISFIEKYDEFLAEYIICHLEVLDSIKVEINKIKNRWNYFIKNNTNNKWELLLERIRYYIEINNINIFELEKLYFNLLNYNPSEDIIEKKITYKQIFNFFTKSIDKNNLNFIEYKHFLKVKEIFVNTLNLDIVDNEYCDIDFYNNLNKNEANNETKILELKRRGD